MIKIVKRAKVRVFYQITDPNVGQKRISKVRDKFLKIAVKNIILTAINVIICLISVHMLLWEKTIFVHIVQIKLYAIQNVKHV
jgi:hypothetical protein